MVREIKVSLSHGGTPLASPQPTAVGSGSGQLTSALQLAAQRTNDLLTNLINGCESFLDSSNLLDGEEEEDSDEEAEGSNEEKDTNNDLLQPKRLKA